jgi:heparan-alpha-glucosaminide N-acetyltransferase
LGIAQMAAAHPGTFWEVIKPQFEHKAWQGCSLWDLIQPSFMFMVGVAVPFSSCAKRREHGQGVPRHGLACADTFAILLVALGVMLATKATDKQTVFLFTNVLAQIGLGYFFLFHSLASRLGIHGGGHHSWCWRGTPGSSFKHPLPFGAGSRRPSRA